MQITMTLKACVTASLTIIAGVAAAIDTAAGVAIFAFGRITGGVIDRLLFISFLLGFAVYLPLAMKIMKADDVILIEGVPIEGAAPPFAMIAHFQFASLEAMKAAVSNPAMAEVRADVGRFSDITPTAMFGKSL